VRAAIDSGITLLDTAQAYRSSEGVLGAALKDGYRERCFLATKASRDFSPQGIRAAIEDSLRALDVEYVDLYQIHRWQPEYPVEESMETLVRLQEEGKVRFFGVSNYNAKQMAQALQAARYHSNQVRYNLFDRGIEAEDAPFCAREGIGIMVHSPLAKGLLTSKYAPGHRFPDDDERSRFPRFQGETFDRYLDMAGKLAEVARDLELSLVQLAIAWALRLEPVSCVLVGAKNPGQVADHLGAVGARLGAEDLARIEAILADAPLDD
jgi:aryl-alcohol dehydrogenase-like predicted oxidoreductase